MQSGGGGGEWPFYKVDLLICRFVDFLFGKIISLARVKLF